MQAGYLNIAYFLHSSRTAHTTPPADMRLNKWGGSNKGRTGVGVERRIPTPTCPSILPTCCCNTLKGGVWHDAMVSH